MIAAAVGALLAASLKGSVLLAAAWAATRGMRRAPAAARHLVWSAALLGVLVLPALELVVPALPVLPRLEAPKLEIGPVMVTESGPAPELAAARTEPTSISTPTSTSPSVPTPVSFDLLSLLPLVWALGSILVLSRLLAGLVGVWWLGRRATMVTDGGWLHLAHDLARRLGLTRGVTLLRGDRGTVPMTWGVLQPIIWLPAESEEWAPERRAVVLAHELAHVRRRDALTQWIAHLAVVVHWFNPLVWHAAGKLREERERACDDAVLSIGTRAADYADHLLEIVRGYGERGGPAAAMAMARRSQFEGRLLAILDRAARRGGVSTRTALGAAAFVLLGALPIAALRAGAVTPPAELSTALPTLASALVRAPAAAEPVAPEDGLPVAAPAAVSRDTIPRPFTSEETGALVGIISEIRSDGDRAALLLRTARLSSITPELLRRIVDSARAIGSDGDRASVLMTVLRRPAADAGVRVAVLEASAGIESDGDQSTILRTALPRLDLGDPVQREALFRALDGIDSSGDRTSILGPILDRPRLDLASLRGVLAAVGELGSDGDAASILRRAALRHPALVRGPARDDFLRAVRTIDSDSDRAAALAPLLFDSESAGTAGDTPASPAKGLWSGSRSEQALTGTHDGKPSFDLTVSGEGVRFAADRRSIAEVRPGGSFRVDHTRHPDSPDPDPLLPSGSRRTLVRSLAVTASDTGIRYDYTVDGQRRPFEGEGHAWLAWVLARLEKS